ncbi:MAG: hypothetical protein HY918_02695 [Candidatus Doudnabacteria bacterium]|nr:hypothetical protein [Candidatus Doudnabacteria bacterium]
MPKESGENKEGQPVSKPETGNEEQTNQQERPPLFLHEQVPFRTPNPTKGK